MGGWERSTTEGKKKIHKIHNGWKKAVNKAKEIRDDKEPLKIEQVSIMGVNTSCNGVVRVSGDKILWATLHLTVVRMRQKDV